MKNSLLSWCSIILLLMIFSQFLYFHKSIVSTSEEVSLVSLPNKVVENAVNKDTAIVQANWSFSDGQLTNEVKPEVVLKPVIPTEKKKVVKKEPFIPPVQIIQPVITESPRYSPTHQIRYLGLADTEKDTAFFFEVDGEYISLKLGDVYNSLKLISVSDSNITLTDRSNDQNYSLSK